MKTVTPLASLGDSQTAQQWQQSIVDNNYVFMYMYHVYVMLYQPLNCDSSYHTTLNHSNAENNDNHC